MSTRTMSLMAGMVLLGAACGERSAAERRSTERGHDAALRDTLTSLIAEAYDFSRPGAVERMTALYPETGPVVSASAGHVTATRDSLRHAIATFWQNVGRNMRESRWEWGAVHVERLGPDAAALTGEWTIPHIAPDGEPHVIGGVWTAVFRRIGGAWRIVQEHLSVPPAEAAG